MNFPETAELEIRAKHFIGTSFTDCQNCAIAKAARDAFPGYKAAEGTRDFDLFTGYWGDEKQRQIHVKYNHSPYEDSKFSEDLLKAKTSDPEKVIRILTIHKADTEKPY